MYRYETETCKLTPYRPKKLWDAVTSIYDQSFIYKLGKTVEPKQGFYKYNLDCAAGIHGFLTPEEAILYKF